MLDWERDILPVLRATYDLMDEEQDDAIETEVLNARLVTEERDEGALYRIFTQIGRTGYADVQFAGGMTVAFVQPTEKGLQVTRGWPVPGQADAEALLRLLDQRIASPDTSEEERTGLTQLRDAAGRVSQSALSSLLGAWLSHVAGPGGS
jgi:hypothetical protein